MFRALFLVLFCCGTILSASSDFPDSWIGTWRGNVGTPEHPLVMQLRIQKLGVGRYTWYVKYQNEGERYYELLEVDPFLGRFHVDEKDGTLLDHTYSRGVLHSAFTANGRLVVFQYEMTDAGLRVIAPYFSGQGRTMGDNGHKVCSYSLVAMQAGLLSRVP